MSATLLLCLVMGLLLVTGGAVGIRMRVVLLVLALWDLSRCWVGVYSAMRAQQLWPRVRDALESSRAAMSESSSRSKDISTALSTTAYTSGPAASNSPSSSSNSRMSGEAVAGIALDGLVGVSLFFAAVFFARRATMWKKAAALGGPTGGTEGETMYGSSTGEKTAQYKRSEMDVDSQVHELPAGTEAAQELVGRAPQSELPA